MTTANTSQPVEPALNPVRCAATGAVLLGLIFVVCWILAISGMSGASHMYLSLFTVMPMNTASGLVVGGLCALASGAVLGALFAVIYNFFGFLARR